MAKKNDKTPQKFVCRSADQSVIGYGDDAAEATAICDEHRTSGRGHATFMLEDWVAGMVQFEGSDDARIEAAEVLSDTTNQ